MHLNTCEHAYTHANTTHKHTQEKSEKGANILESKCLVSITDSCMSVCKLLYPFNCPHSRTEIIIVPNLGEF